MKNILSLLLLAILSISAIGQTNIPQLVSFSAVVRDGNNQPLVSTPVSIRLTFREGGQTGPLVYCALHQTTTNQNGFMSLQLNRDVLGTGCNGAPSTAFENIAWDNGNFWMEVEYQTTPSTPFENLGQLELASSFYAFAAGTAESISGMELTGADDGDVLTYNITSGQWEPMPSGGGFSGDYNDLTNPPTIPTNTSDLTNDSGFITNPDDADADSTNELQTLSISNDTIYLSNGGFALLPTATSNATGGKTYIELFDDITDAEAVALFASDLGPNTQFVYITNTTNLTTVDLAGINSLIELKIQNNSLLTNVITSSITRVSNFLTVSNNPLLSSFQMDNVTAIGEIGISNNAAMTTLSFANLTRANYLTIADNGLTSLDLSGLTNLTDGLDISDNASLSTLALASLTTASSVRIWNNGLTSLDLSGLTNLTSNFSIQGNASLSTLAVASLSTARSVSISNNGLTSLDLSGLTTLTSQWEWEGLDISDNASLSTLAVASLTTAGYVSIHNNGLTSLDLSGLTSVTGQCGISNNDALTDIVWSGSVAWGGDINISICALPATEINEILALMVANGSGNPIWVGLFGQTPPAPPTGQGIIDVGTLQGWGFDVYTD